MFRSARSSLLSLLPFLAWPAYAQFVFVNELHYDNVGVDAGEAVEIVAPAGTDLGGFEVVLYDGLRGVPYGVLLLGGVVPAEAHGLGALAFSFAVNGLQNGPDGLALVDAAGVVVDRLAWEGDFLALEGPAAGLVFEDVGPRESGATPIGHSLQLVGLGAGRLGLQWYEPRPSSFGRLNEGQVFGAEDIETVSIPEIQGAGHWSPWRGRVVATSGVVTAVEGLGFDLLDPAGDGRLETSDALSVFVGSVPAVAVGDAVVVVGVVEEFARGGSVSPDLPLTELAAGQVIERQAGALVPAAVRLGVGGRAIPDRVVCDDGLASFDAASDGIDFWESLESMRVVLPDARAIAPSSFFDETFAVADGGAGASVLSSRGVLVGGAGDGNPERLRVVLPRGVPEVGVRDRLGDVEGTLSYAFGGYELRARELPGFAPSPFLPPEVTSLSGGPGLLAVATYNVRNLGPGAGDRFDVIAAQITDALAAPDVVALQEVQDSDGPVDSGETDAAVTWQALVDALAARGTHYLAFDRAPEDGADGGRPGANIRVGVLLREGRVRLVPGSVRRLLDEDPSDGDAFAGSRKPLVVEIEVGPAGPRVLVVVVHFTSRFGSSPDFGAIQPPTLAGAAARLAQARELHAFVARARAEEPARPVIVLGDANDTEFGPALAALEAPGPGAGPMLANLARKLAPADRYSFVFEGNAQLFDHVLVGIDLFDSAEIDLVHGNAERADAVSDHDPVVARLDLTALPEPGSSAAAAALVALLLVRVQSSRVMARSGQLASARRASSRCSSGTVSTSSTQWPRSSSPKTSGASS